MKYALIKINDIKLLINDGCHMQPLIDNFKEIEELNDKVISFYKNLMTTSDEAASNLEKEKQILMSKIGYNIIGVPFTNHDAELYALDKKLDYDAIELNSKQYERINVDVEKPLKTLAVKHVNNSYHKNLAEYIQHLIKKDLGI